MDSEKSMGDINTEVYKWHKCYEETSKHDDCVELENITFKESCM